MQGNLTSAGSLTALLCELISIPSVNPTYDADSHGEVAVADFVGRRCAAIGLDVEHQSVVDGRQNVLARLDVHGAANTLLFETHMDTVALSERTTSLTPVVRDGAIYGRGACDAKGSLAAMLITVESLVNLRRELKTNVVLLAAADEEFKFRGVLKFIASGEKVDAAIVGEPTDLKIVTAHKGSVRFRLTTLGKAAHSSRPKDGVNAITAMAKVIKRLEQLGASFSHRLHPLVGSPTLSIGRIWGGVGVNTVADRCTIEVDRRLVPGETAEAALAEIDAAVGELNIEFEREEPFLVTPTLGTSAGAKVVVAAQAACRAVGMPDGLVGVPFGSDASKLSAYGNVPSIVLGPGSITEAHAANERIQIEQLVGASKIYEATALLFSGL